MEIPVRTSFEIVTVYFGSAAAGTPVGSSCLTIGVPVSGFYTLATRSDEWTGKIRSFSTTAFNS
jgi:hypothetical protein